MKSHILFKISVLLIFVFMSMDHLFSQNTIRIMPLGNSVTEGEDAVSDEAHKKSYRYGLKYLMESAGYSIDFVGSEESGWAYFSDCQHAGIGGSRDQYVARLLIDGYDQRNDVQILVPPRPYLDEYNPDIILLHIGTNDVTHEEDVITNQQVSTILDLVDQYEARSGKEVTVFLALIINRKLLPDGSERPGTYTTRLFNNAIKSMAEARIAAGDKIVIVDMEHDAGFLYTNVDMSSADPEGLHPNEVGYNKMAALWFSAITNYYNTAPVISNIPDQTVNEGSSFSVIHLDDYVSDVEDPDEDITWIYSQLGTAYLNITINQNREAIITPIDSNWSGTQTVVFKATDTGVNGGGFQKSDYDTVNFTVTPVNDPPIVMNQQSLSVKEDTSITLQLSDFTVYDPDSDPSTFQLIVLPGNNYSVNGLKVTLAHNYDSILDVNIAVRDASLQGPVFQAKITVIPINDPPVFNGQSPIDFDEDTPYTLNISDLSVTDPDNSVSELSLIMQSGNNYTINGNLIIPKKDYNGILFIPTYIEDPEHAKTTLFNLVATVNPVNDPPLITSEPVITATENSLYIYSITATDVDDQNLTCETEHPVWLNFFSNSKLLAGTPGHSDAGFNHVVVKVSDGKDTAKQSYYIQVSPVSALPEVTFTEYSVYPNPAFDYVIIDNPDNNSSLAFELSDITGKQVLREDFITGRHRINFDDYHLLPGIYIFRLTNKNKIVSGKLIIQRQPPL